MSTNESTMSSRLVRKQKQLRDVRHVLWMQDDSGSDLDFVDFDVSADKSSTEREKEGLPLIQLQAATASTSATTELASVTADRCAATLPANKCVIYGFYISQIFILSSNDLSEGF